jgi:hypothetical protein
LIIIFFKKRRKDEIESKNSEGISNKEEIK